MATSLAIKQETSTTGSCYTNSIHALHTTPHVNLPHQLFCNQRINLPTSELNKIGITSTSPTNSLFTQSHDQWLEFMRFGLELDLTDTKLLSKFIHTKNNSVEQGEILEMIKDQTLHNLDNEFKKISTNMINALNDHNIVIPEHLEKWNQTSFGYSLNFNNSDDLNNEQQLALRLQANNGLNVLSINILNNVPLPLKRIGALLLNILSYSSDKLLSKDLCYSINITGLLSELIESFNEEEIKQFLTFVHDSQQEKAIKLLESKHCLEELIYYYGDDLKEILQECAYYFEWFSSYNYFKYFEKQTDYSNIEAMTTLITNELNKLKTQQNPCIGHPFYQHLNAINAIAKNKLKPVLNNFISPESDNYYCEFNVISLSDDDNIYLDTLNENIMSSGEDGYAILEMKNPKHLMNYFNNLIVCDHLLIAFDM